MTERHGTLVTIVIVAAVIAIVAAASVGGARTASAPGADVGASCNIWCLIGAAGAAAGGWARDKGKKKVENAIDNAISAFGWGWKKAADGVKAAQEAAGTVRDEVFAPIGETVAEILGSGNVPDQADGGLGTTHHTYKEGAEKSQGVDSPYQGEGPLPGYGYEGVGGDRHGGGGSGGGGTGGGSGGGTTPLGGGEATSPPSGGTETPSAPTHEDLGVDPGSYIEYQPGSGQVVVTHPDGTTTTMPWP